MSNQINSNILFGSLLLGIILGAGFMTCYLIIDGSAVKLNEYNSLKSRVEILEEAVRIYKSRENTATGETSIIGNKISLHMKLVREGNSFNVITSYGYVGGSCERFAYFEDAVEYASKRGGILETEGTYITTRPIYLANVTNFTFKPIEGTEAKVIYFGQYGYVLKNSVNVHILVPWERGIK